MSNWISIHAPKMLDQRVRTLAARRGKTTSEMYAELILCGLEIELESTEPEMSSWRKIMKSDFKK
jgi:predicted DNA-binding protein